MKPTSHNLLIFIKNPVLGHAKTRIAATVGDDAALSIYHQLLDTVRSNTLPLQCNKYLFYSSEILADDGWEASAYRKHLQVSGDLGYKMLSAFEEINVLHADEPKVLIGSDCPTLTGEIITLAFEQLGSHDIVLGPTFDGGYYLIGMNKIHADLFADIEWSTEAVFEQTMAKAKLIGCSVAILPMLNDIDDEGDWLAYQNRK